MKTLIKNGQVWIKDKFENLDVLLDGATISKVAAKIEDNADEVIDAKGKFVLPGIIDCHVHLSMDGSPRPMAKLSKQREAEAMVTAMNSCRELVESGVTTIRECGGMGYESVILREEVKSGNVVGPRIYTCGKAMKIVGGHFVGYEITGPNEARFAARDMIEHGAEYLKFMASGGMGKQGEQPGVVQLDVDEMRAAIREGEKHGMASAAHCHSKDAMLNAMEAGITTIEHGTFLDEEVVQKMLEHDVFFVPTFSPYCNMTRDGRAGGVSEYMCGVAEQITEYKNRTFHLAYDAGVKIAFGRDSGAPLTRHSDWPREMTDMEAAGMSKKDIIISATETAAKACQMWDKIGSLEVGKSADVIIADANPLDDLNNFRKLSHVFACGRKIR